MIRSALPALAVSLAIAATARPALAVDPVPSFRYLVTGNGFGFQVFEVTANAIPAGVDPARGSAGFFFSVGLPFKRRPVYTPCARFAK